MSFGLSFKSAPLLLAAALALGGASAVQAQVTINYTLGAYAFSFPGVDASFSLADSAQSLTLMPGVAQTVDLQTAAFDVFPTIISTDVLDTLSRPLAINGVTHNAAQDFEMLTGDPDGVNTLYADDKLTFSAGQAINYDLGAQGIVTFTPEALDGGGIFHADSNADGVSGSEYLDNVQGTFLLTPAAVPEASTTVSLGLLLALGSLSLLTAQSRRHPRKAAPVST